MKKIQTILSELEDSSNFRQIPRENAPDKIIDLSSNDYLGIASDFNFREEFYTSLSPADFLPTSSASRLLASRQEEYRALEDILDHAYSRPALLFNSGYHANTGIIKALADKSTLFVADKLVHASIIDGLNLAASAGAKFIRFRHNDWDHLDSIVTKQGSLFSRVVIVAESVYSMDGDMASLNRLVAAKNLHQNALIYLDEAHGIGVLGPKGLGLAAGHPQYKEVDIIVGTFGKALASMGAFAITSPILRDFLINTARPLIFSTAIPPVTARWSLATLKYTMGADNKRQHLNALAKELGTILGSDASTPYPTHIQPLILGDAARTLALSAKLLQNGFRVLPIRTPTVPKGTERLRFSLSASLNIEDLAKLKSIIHAGS